MFPNQLRNKYEWPRKKIEKADKDYKHSLAYGFAVIAKRISWMYCAPLENLIAQVTAHLIKSSPF